MVAFSPDGKRLASLVNSILVGGWSEVKIWELETDKEPITLRGSDRELVKSLAFSPDGRRLATGGSSLEIWDAGTGKKLKSLTGAAVGATNSVCFSPDGQRIAAPASDRTVKIWDSNTHGPSRLMVMESDRLQAREIEFLQLLLHVRPSLLDPAVALQAAQLPVDLGELGRGLGCRREIAPTAFTCRRSPGCTPSFASSRITVSIASVASADHGRLIASK